LIHVFETKTNLTQPTGSIYRTPSKCIWTRSQICRVGDTMFAQILIASGSKMCMDLRVAKYCSKKYVWNL